MSADKDELRRLYVRALAMSEDGSLTQAARDKAKKALDHAEAALGMMDAIERRQAFEAAAATAFASEAGIEDLTAPVIAPREPSDVNRALVIVGVVTTLPLVALNWVGGLAGGIWLAIRGDWGALGIGAAAMVFGQFVLAFAMGLGMVIAVPGAKLADRSKVLAAPFFIATALWNVAVMTAWCVTTFSMLMSRANGSVWPYLLWAYSTATVPWNVLAKREMQSDPTSTSLMWVQGVQLGALAAAVSVLVGEGNQTDLGIVVFFVPVAVLGIFLGSKLSAARASGVSPF